MKPARALLSTVLLAVVSVALAGDKVIHTIASCELQSVDCRLSNALRQIPNLGGKKLRVFVAEPPYSVLVNGYPATVNLEGKPRLFDFSGDRPFINPETGVSDIATLNAWNIDKYGHSASILAGAQIRNEGVPGRIFKHKKRTVLAYVAGDPPVAGKCRSQLSSYPVPSRKRFLFDLTFQLGENAAGLQWHISPPNTSPVVLWQMKAPRTIPSMIVAVDTDQAHPERLLLYFARKGGNSKIMSRVGNPVSFPPYQAQHLLMDIYLDEREVTADGGGYWRAWVNGTQVLDSFGPTLSATATEPHQWFLALYHFNNPQPLPFTRSVLWDRAVMYSTE